MNESATSLDRLHDLVLPPAVPLWPLAPGWYVVFTLALVAAAWMAFRAWKRWQSNAYRREALRELAWLQTPAAIAELLRRTALAIAPRPVIAEKTSTAWLDWLAAEIPEPMPDTVRTQLTTGVYGPPAASQELNALRDYASRWITRHRRIQPLTTDH
jgi:Domain of unknown function (DUF4381)